MIDLQTETKAWEPRQIAKRAEAQVRQQFSVAEEMILNRKLQGVASGAYTLSAEEQAQVAAFQAVTLQAQQAAIQAHQDNELLKQALAYERALARLARYRLADGLSGGWSVIDIPIAVGGFVQLPGGDVGSVMSLSVDPESGDSAAVQLASETLATVLVADLVPVQWVEPVDPLPATVTVIAEDGSTSEQPNPAIVQDDAERVAAQAIIDGASQTVIDLVEVRANA